MPPSEASSFSFSLPAQIGQHNIDAKYFKVVAWKVLWLQRGFATVGYIIIFKFKLFFLNISIGYEHLNM